MQSMGTEAWQSRRDEDAAQHMREIAHAPGERSGRDGVSGACGATDSRN